MTPTNLSFAVGPSQIHPIIPKVTQTFFSEGLGSISHRSSAFRQLHAHTISQLKKLLSIPEDFGIFFAGSASEIWERILLQLNQTGSYHWTNGSFSNRFYEYAQQLGLAAEVNQKPDHFGFTLQDIPTHTDANLICLTQNETATGVMLQNELIREWKARFPEKIIALDVVSSCPVYVPDWNLVDTAFFSVQKCFGMPAGLGVWIVAPHLLPLSAEIAKKRSIGAHHTLANHWKNFNKNETHSTPNVLGIFQLGEICQHYNQHSFSDTIVAIKHRAHQFYSQLESNPNLFPAVTENIWRSYTTLVLESTSVDTIQKIINTLKASNIEVSSGYGAKKSLQIRIANFPAISSDQWNQMTQKIMDII